jgi:hypothetical protein
MGLYENKLAAIGQGDVISLAADSEGFDKTLADKSVQDSVDAVEV